MPRNLDLVADVDLSARYSSSCCETASAGNATGKFQLLFVRHYQDRAGIGVARLSRDEVDTRLCELAVTPDGLLLVRCAGGNYVLAAHSKLPYMCKPCAVEAMKFGCLLWDEWL